MIVGIPKAKPDLSCRILVLHQELFCKLMQFQQLSEVSINFSIFTDKESDKIIQYFPQNTTIHIGLTLVMSLYRSDIISENM